MTTYLELYTINYFSHHTPLFLLEITYFYPKKVMKHVSIKSIEKAITKVDNLNEDGLEKLAETYALAQQVLLGYIMSAATEYKNEQLEGLLIYYYCLLSEAFEQEGVLLDQITEDQIDAFEEPFFEMLDQYFDKDEDEIINNFVDQPELTQFMMIEISTEDEDGTSLEDETATQLFIVTTAMIALMNRSVKA
jgi:hypothetical protein